MRQSKDWWVLNKTSFHTQTAHAVTLPFNLSRSHTKHWSVAKVKSKNPTVPVGMQTRDSQESSSGTEVWLYHHHHHHHHHVLFCVLVFQIGARSRLHIKETKHSQNGARRSPTDSVLMLADPQNDVLICCLRDRQHCFALLTDNANNKTNIKSINKALHLVRREYPQRHGSPTRFLMQTDCRLGPWLNSACSDDM